MCNDEKLWEIRVNLARSARQKRNRSADFSRSEPTEWTPQKVINPQTGVAFTPDGAWEFVAEKLEDKGVGVKEKELDKHKHRGKKGYIMKIETQNGTIYIKVRFGNGGKIKGISFHN